MDFKIFFRINFNISVIMILKHVNLNIFSFGIQLHFEGKTLIFQELDESDGV